MTHSKLATLSLVLAAASLSACSTVKMPNLDFLKSSEFEEDAKNIGDYPEPADAPTAPDDVRSAALWDIEAKKMIKERDSFNSAAVNMTGPAKTEAELERELAALRAKARAYQADDPK
ncbi:hypothetical protein [Hellea balneolensis]|uniref:hypothetical protein n=1 Tax=Hellea balneolensis TaxID=287478 RepID=UPI00040FDE60|nr:hypothetical protein [Hellea balneolensis]